MKDYRTLVPGLFAAFAAMPAAAEVPISDIPLFINAVDGDSQCDVDGSGTTTSTAAGSTKANGETLIFQAEFDGGDWSGELSAYPYGRVGDDEAAEWHASEGIPAPAGRAIFTVDDGGNGIAFEWAALDAEAQAALNDDRRLLDYIRGDRSDEGGGDDDFRPRGNVLGDIVHSVPAYVGEQDYGYGVLPPPRGDGYRSFVRDKNRRGDLVLVGANDGMLHVFAADGGEEIFAYLPRSLLPALPELAGRDYEHRYYVDGSPSVADAHIDGSWRTVAVTTLGRGGPGAFALDVTDPDGLGAGSVLWEVAPGSIAMKEGTADPGAYLGTAMGAPAVARTESGDWVAIFGNGYNSTGETAALIVVDLADGEVLRVLDTKAAGDNGLATPAAVDRDRDGSVDTVYAGDLEGNLWKFDLSADNPRNWAVDYGGAPLFAATDPDGVPQPITARPDVMVSPHGGLMIVFGTGKYLGAPDLRNTDTQSVYGIRDVEGATGAGGEFDDVPVGGLEELQRQHIVRDASVGDTDVRVLSRAPVDYEGDDARRGWVFDLNRPGERIHRDVTVFDGKAILVTTVPEDDPCAFGGHGALIEIDPLTGTQFDEPVLDLNGDGRFDDQDGIADDGAEGGYVYPAMIDLDVGLAADPAILIREDGDHDKRIAGSAPATRTIGEKAFFRPGRASWQQIR